MIVVRVIAAVIVLGAVAATLVGWYAPTREFPDRGRHYE